MNVITKTVALPDGRTISIETGKLAKQADGAVVVRMGNTMLLATVCCAKDAVPGPFAIVNADDYYGSNAFKELYKHLTIGKFGVPKTKFFLRERVFFTRFQENRFRLSCLGSL